MRIRKRWGNSSQVEGDPMIDPLVFLFVGYVVGVALGLLAGVDALLRAGRAGARVTTWRRAASWWFWRNPEEAEA